MASISPYLHISPDPGIWLIQLFAIVLATVCINFVLMRVLDAVERATDRTASVWDDALIHAARVPLRLLVWVVGLSAAVRLIQAVEPSLVFDYAPEVRRVAIIGIVAMFALRLIRHTEENLVDPERAIRPVDQTTAKAIGKLLRLAVLITATLVGMQTLGFSISGVVAAGGVSGIAIGFAAKDLLANFFGALMIYWDKPFKEGDWIRSPDKEIEGTVEEIGWRLTRIRTFDKRPLYVPNSVFNNIAVENPSRMQNRRIKETLGIRYDDAAQMAAICDAVRAMIQNHPDIDQDTTQIVHFNAFNASSIDFLLYCYTRTTKWVEYHKVKQDVLLKILDIVSAHGAQFAYPTQTLQLPGVEAELAHAAQAPDSGAAGDRRAGNGSNAG